MSDLEKTIRKALKELAIKRARVERAIEELGQLKQERSHIVKAMEDLEDALEHLTSSSTPRRRKTARKPGTAARRQPDSKTRKATRTTGKNASKKAPQADAWTPAKRRAMAARMRKIWATRRKKR